MKVSVGAFLAIHPCAGARPRRYARLAGGLPGMADCRSSAAAAGGKSRRRAGNTEWSCFAKHAASRQRHTGSPASFSTSAGSGSTQALPVRGRLAAAPQPAAVHGPAAGAAGDAPFEGAPITLRGPPPPAGGLDAAAGPFRSVARQLQLLPPQRGMLTACHPGLGGWRADQRPATLDQRWQGHALVQPCAHARQHTAQQSPLSLAEVGHKSDQLCQQSSRGSHFRLSGRSHHRLQLLPCTAAQSSAPSLWPGCSSQHRVFSPCNMHQSAWLRCHSRSSCPRGGHRRYRRRQEGQTDRLQCQPSEASHNGHSHPGPCSLPPGFAPPLDPRRRPTKLAAACRCWQSRVPGGRGPGGAACDASPAGC